MSDGSYKTIEHILYTYIYILCCFGDGGVYGVVVFTSAKNISVHDRILFVKRLSILSDLHGGGGGGGGANTLATAPQEFVRRRL